MNIDEAMEEAEVTMELHDLYDAAIYSLVPASVFLRSMEGAPLLERIHIAAVMMATIATSLVRPGELNEDLLKDMGEKVNNFLVDTGPSAEDIKYILFCIASQTVQLSIGGSDILRAAFTQVLDSAERSKQ